MIVTINGHKVGTLPEGTVVYKSTKNPGSDNRWARKPGGNWARINPLEGVVHTYSTWETALNLGFFVPDPENTSESWEVTF